MKRANYKTELLEFVKQAESSGMPRLQAFDIFAKKYNLKCETIRNLYYRLVKDRHLQKEHNIERSKPFGRQELKVSMTKIINELQQNKSLRKACYIVSNGDAKLMLRLQNKFRSLQKSNLQYLQKLGYNSTNNIQQFINSNKLSKDSLLLKNNTILGKNNMNTAKIDSYTLKNDNNEQENNAKILRMPNNNFLTDNDINNLFMGLVRMVKRNAIESAPTVLKNECELANASLKDALVKLGVSTRKLEVIKCENFELKQKLQESEKLLKNARCEVAELLNKIDSAGKIEELKNFINDYKKKLKKTYQDTKTYN